METKVIKSEFPLPRAKIRVGNTVIVTKQDSLFGEFSAYQFDTADAEVIKNLIEILQKIIKDA